MQNYLKHTAISLLTLSLVACGDSDKAEETPAAPAPAEAESEAAGGVKEAAKEVVEKVKEAIKLDTSSPEAFKASLAAMKDSLSDADKGKLSDALSNLGKKAIEGESKDGLLGKVKDVASGGSLEDGLLDKFGGDLNGMTFEDLLDFAGN